MRTIPVQFVPGVRCNVFYSAAHVTPSTRRPPAHTRPSPEGRRKVREGTQGSSLPSLSPPSSPGSHGPGQDSAHAEIKAFSVQSGPEKRECAFDFAARPTHAPGMSHFNASPTLEKGSTWTSPHCVASGRCRRPMRCPLTVVR
eukprot:545582-Rhodomonas_salina.1